MKRKRTVLVISCLVGLVSAAGYMSRLQAIRNEMAGLEERAPVLAAGRTIRAGEMLTPDNLVAVMTPRLSLPRRALTPDDLELVAGRRTLNAIPAGDPVLWTDLPEGPRLKSPSESVPPGSRAIALPADEIHTMVHFLAPGDRVDVLLSSFRESSGRLVTDKVAEDVLVLGIGEHTAQWDREREDGDYPLSITLLTTPDVAISIIQASQSGEIHFMVRGRDVLSELLTQDPDMSRVRKGASR